MESRGRYFSKFIWAWNLHSLANLFWLFNFINTKLLLQVTASVIFIVYSFKYLNIRLKIGDSYNSGKYIVVLIFSLGALLVGSTNLLYEHYWGVLMYDIGGCAFVLGGLLFLDAQKSDISRLVRWYLLWNSAYILVFFQRFKLDFFFNSLSRTDILMEMAQNSGQFSVYSVLSISLSLLPLMILISLEYRTNHKIWFAILMLVYAIFGLYYAKKNVIIELIVSFLVLAFNSNRSFVKKLGGAIIFGLSFFFLVRKYQELNFIKRYIDRFIVGINGRKTNDRVLELHDYFEGIDYQDLFIGLGFGEIAADTVGGFVLHIGFFNIVMKFGLFGVLVFTLFLAFRLIQLIVSKTKMRWFNLQVLSLFMLFLFLSPLWSWYINMLYFSLMMFGLRPIDLKT